MTQLQALVTGAILGALMGAEEVGLLLDVHPRFKDGNYMPEIEVVGRESREALLIRVETVE